MSSAAGSGSAGSASPIGHAWVAGSGSRLATWTGVKLGVAWPTRQRDASLIAQVNGGAPHAVRERDVHGPGGAIDHRLAEPGALLVRRGEVADVLGGEVGVEAGDEHGGAHDLGEAGGVVFQRVAGRRHVGRVELERLRPGDQRIVGPLRGAGKSVAGVVGRIPGSIRKSATAWAPTGGPIPV